MKPPRIGNDAATTHISGVGPSATEESARTAAYLKSL